MTWNMWHVTSWMWHMGCWTLSQNSSCLPIMVKRIVLSEGFNHILYLISFHFGIFFKILSWLGNILFGLLIWSAPALVEGPFLFVLWKMPSYNPLQNALIQNAIFKKGFMNKRILSSGIGGHFESANVKCPFALPKMLFYIPWQNALIKNVLLKRAFW